MGDLGHDLERQTADDAVLLTGNLKTLTHDTLEPLPNTGYSVPDSTIHTMSNDLAKSIRMNGQGGPTTTLGDWLTQMATDDPKWQSWIAP